MPKEERNIETECWNCKHRQNIPGDCHITCDKPDPKMTGVIYGIREGWFNYPWNFDPIWKTKLCTNFEKEESKDGYNN